MHNERTKGNVADLLDTVNQHIRSIAEVQQKRVELTATATAGKGRVRITVNADGVVIDTEFSDDIDDLDYDEIADAVTEATQDAAAEVARKAEELIAPIRDTRSRLPSLSSLVEGLPDIRTKTPELQRASFESLAARQERAAEPQGRPWSVTDHD
ncbi:YbaB/EbfC family nucleoid-associated protein [Nocardia brasiliensis]|uniref:YbaB/EbfC family nucleoid-associated protein n=1 Tax=Nocardia brasiliensis TaxID=37326 RepID=UPI001895C50B|nr:YbaB/EbfC family nucleoid-associated protein [Nocardia brasiliensis]MBF6130647.1 YbaB/EbfC family nucleoid-associated protein [Nocardia brasiliensis]